MRKEIEDTKQNHELQIQQLQNKQEKIRLSIAELKTKRNESKEAYYGAMIAYEVEQRFIRDIMWLDKTKQGVLQRNER